MDYCKENFVPKSDDLRPGGPVMVANLRRFTIGLLAGFLLATVMVAVADDSEARVIRVEKADRPKKSAKVKYIEKVSVRTKNGWKRSTYVELFNGATFRVTKCKKPVRINMRMKKVRHLCGRR